MTTKQMFFYCILQKKNIFRKKVLTDGFCVYILFVMGDTMLVPVAQPYRVTSKYGPRILNGKPQYHKGIDFVSCTGLRDVYAGLDGIVKYDKDNYDHSKRWLKGNTGGNLVILQHEINKKIYYTRYLHLGRNTVKVGDVVHRGQMIGEYGDYGRSYGAHLHFDLLDSKWRKINPTSWFANLEV